MSHPSRSGEPSPSQEAIRAKCFHPSGSFIEFRKEEIEQSIPERFEKIVRMYPDKLAVKDADHAVTYAKLNAMANRFGHAILSSQGNKAEPIGVLFERGTEQIAAMMGVLKAGKFFVVLDASFPKPRITAMLDHAQVKLVVAGHQASSLAQEVASSGCRLMEVESIDNDISTEELRLAVSPQMLAFILYTSGSTGQPKGVVQNHRNVLHNIMLRTNEYHVCEHDRLSLLASGTANAVINMFLALLNGAALLPFDVQRQGLTDLPGWFLRERISFCWISPPLFRGFCKMLTGRERFADLRFMGLGGDTVHKTDVDLYKTFLANCLLAINLTGTETGLLRTYFIDRETEIFGDEVPLGYPVDGKEILLLDDTGNEVGFNEIGEIVVRSLYLSPGYWRGPDLTEAKFRPDPDGGDRRLYFTGDLGLMLPDGCLIHKGRKDFRVKIRGYSIEAVEVERALRAHAAINEAVVVAHGNKSGEPRLVAYFTSPSQPGPSVGELRRFLKNKLPDYMIPSSFMMLRVMPLTPNGKVDRRALPDPGNSRPELDTPFVAPGTPVEEELAEIWAEILSLDQVGVYDNFFDLGGHSLAATQIISRVIHAFGVELPVRSLLQAPTVAEMAVVIVRNQAGKVGQEDLARLLSQLESLSDEEARRLLAEDTASRMIGKRHE